AAPQPPSAQGTPGDPPPNAFTPPNPESFAGHMRADARNEKNAGGDSSRGPNEPPSTIADPAPQTGTPTAHVLEAASAGTSSNTSTAHDQSPAAAAPDTPSTPPTPDRQIVPANAAAPAQSTVPVSQSA